MRGRKPKPTVLKLLTGNAGRRPLNEHEPKPKAGIPGCPRFLDATARTEWRRISKELAAVGLVTHIDRAALAAYCQWFSRVAKLEGIVQRVGECLAEMEDVPELDADQKPTGRMTRRPTGRVLRNPYAAELRAAYRQMLSFLSEFGMTPSSRTRLSIVPPSPAQSGFQALLNRA